MLDDKLRAIIGRRGPAIVTCADGKTRDWPLAETPLLLIVVPGALTVNGQRRERAEAVAWQVGKIVLELDRYEQLPQRTPGLPIAAVCELEELRSVGCTGPIWRVIRHPSDSNPVHGIPTWATLPAWLNAGVYSTRPALSLALALVPFLRWRTI